MLFDIEYFDQLPNGYSKAVIELDNDLKEASNNFTKHRILSTFAKTFTTITPIWEYWKRHALTTPNSYENIMEQQLGHFYSLSTISDFGYLKEQFIQTPLNQKIFNNAYRAIINSRIKKTCRNMKEYKEFIHDSEEALKYPSEKLENIYLNYRINLGSFVSEEIKLRYLRSLNLLNELKSAEKDDRKWVECLLKVEDSDFIISNFEFRLEAFPWYQRLWKFYIEYLKKINSNSILDVYSRYCRFFVDDILEVENYRNEIERFSWNLNVTKWWIDTVSYEQNIDETCKILKRALTPGKYKSKQLIKFAEKFLKKIPPNNDADDIKKLITAAKCNLSRRTDVLSNDILSNPILDDESFIHVFSHDLIHSNAEEFAYDNDNTYPIVVDNFATYQIQEFSFPKTICNYIFQNANYLLRQKLFLTCKYFVIRYQTPICCNIVITLSPDPEFYEQSIKIPESSITAVKDFYVVNSLDGWKTENPLTVSLLCSTVYEFDLKFLKLHTQILTWKEFEFLTSPGNIESVYMVYVSISGPNGRPQATLEEILERFPKASRLLLYTPTCHSTKTAQNLLKQKRMVKIERIQFYAHELEAQSFCQFIQENAAPKAKIDVTFETSVQHDYLEIFKENIENMLNVWEPQCEKPEIDIIVF